MAEDKTIYLSVEARVDGENEELCGKTCPHLTMRGPSSITKDACKHFTQGRPFLKFYHPLDIAVFENDTRAALRCEPCIKDGAEI